MRLTSLKRLSVSTLAIAALGCQALAATEEELLERIERLEAALAAQSAALEDYRTQVEAFRGQVTAETDALADARAGAVTPIGQAATGAAAEEPQASPAEPVGEAPDTELRDETQAISTLYDVGGVLTPAGHFVFEPGFEYSHASANRFTFRGVELQEVLLIGAIEASDADRDLVSANASFRYGVTDRFELEARVPFIYRSDDLTFLIPVLGEDEALERTTSLTGSGLGDIEVAGHYQFNSGRNGWPVFVGNAKIKTRTGEGPFDIDRDEFGVEEELPTGSGFYEIEPSLTAILPTDPAVLFANVGYGFRLEDDDINEPIGDFIVEGVDPGDAINASVGMGFAVNDEFSFSLGYKHSLLLETETTLFNPETLQRSTQDSSQLHIGSALFGLSYAVSDRVRINLDFDLGITEDAPDMRASLRVPIQLGKVF